MYNIDPQEQRGCHWGVEHPALQQDQHGAQGQWAGVGFCAARDDAVVGNCEAARQLLGVQAADPGQAVPTGCQVASLPFVTLDE